jgi:hypothetical protein
MRSVAFALAVLALIGCEGADTGGEVAAFADGGEVLEAAAICEGEVEPADEGLWRCPTGEPDSYYVLLEPGEDVEMLTMLYLQDGAGGQLVAGEQPEPWLIDVQDPAVAEEVASRTGGTVVEDDA